MDKALVKKIEKIIDDSFVMKSSKSMSRSEVLEGAEFDVCVLESRKAAEKIVKLLNK